MKIEKLTPSDKHPDRYYAEFTGGEKLTVTVALIADFSLFTGRELNEDEYMSLKAAAETASAKTRALRILGHRNMSRREIIDRLTQKGENEQTAVETAEWLERIGAVNDAEYASLIVRHYLSRGYGKLRIYDELYRRGIEKELWEAALADTTDTADGAYNFLASKLKGTAPDKTELKRLTAAMYRRGFSWDDIKTAITKYKGELDSNQLDTEDLTDNE